MERARRITVVGIDGSGKTTLIDALVRRAPAALGLRRMRLPAYHQERDVPMADLSRDLVELSRIADELGCPELKWTALYLAATLFGVVEAMILDVLRPRTLIEERHPLVDVLTYAPVYADLISRGVRAEAISDEVRARLAERRPGALSAIEGWIAREAERLGEARSLWTYGDHLRSFVELPAEKQMACIARECRAEAPDAVILLDVAPAVAAGRIRLRGKSDGELHEQLPSLISLRDHYYRALDHLARHRPALALEVIRVDDAEPEERTLQDLAERAKLDWLALGSTHSGDASAHPIPREVP